MKIIYCFLILISNNILATQLTPRIDILDQGKIYDLANNNVADTIIYPEISLSGGYYVFNANIRIINKNLENTIRSYIGTSYKNIKDELNKNHTLSVAAGFEFVFENKTIFKPFVDLSQGFSYWRYWKDNNLVDKHGSPFNQGKVGLYISFADHVKFFALQQITSYWSRAPFHKQETGNSRNRILLKYGFSLTL
jgi:hypothetical protein